MADAISITQTQASAVLEQLGPRPSGRLRFLLAPIEVIAAALIAGLVGLVLVSVFSRYVLSSPITSADEIASFLFLWIVMFGSVIAIDRNEHLRLALVLNLVGPRLRGPIETTGYVVVAAFLIGLLPSALEHWLDEIPVVSPGLDISVAWRIAGIPLGIGLMLLVLAVKLWAEASRRDLVTAIAVVAVTVATLWLLSPFFASLGKANILVLLVAVIAICLAIGVPIAFCFGAGAMAFLVFSTKLPVTVIVGRMDEGMSSLILLSVPVFVLLGCILDATGMGKAIVDFLASLLGHVRAGMSYVMLGSLYLVSGISGSKVSDMATVAPALFPEMKRRGNRPEEMVALLGTGAIMADTVPPSIVLIVIGSVAGISIAALFASGFVVAFFLLLILAAAARWKARGELLHGVRRAPWPMIRKALMIAAPALVLPFLVRGAVTEGVATATEVSTIAVVYALIAGMVLYGGIKGRDMYRMLVETAAMTGSILIILGTASAAAWVLTQTGFAQYLAAVMKGLPGGWMVYMGMTVAVFLTLGCLLEGLPAIVLLAPLMFPIANDLGIHGVHYAMVVVVSMNIGLFAPPVGIGYYIACSIGKVSPDAAMKTIWFYLGALLLGLVAIALIPGISTMAL
ncbi:TRAP transporter large permease subunit [Enterovirga sp.]|jgi:tripartite ATP-independent transporter DctM subunit|uniref:TRAP transporter large permease n=1 Tax=Enterovirga sp. TaxID=2026350 RepID=UPI00261BA6BD|nr:TRAP transporter large permease subunit [Enterovirga sp.]MDB5591252.1 dctM-like transporter family protein [Enterovirga sp.]